MQQHQINNLGWFDYWSLFFGIVSLIFSVLLFIIPQQRNIILGALLLSLLSGVIFYYTNKIGNLEKDLKKLKIDINDLNINFTERFNYLRELSDMKLRVTMLEKKRKGQIDLLSLIKLIVAVILVYVIFQVIKSL